MDSLNALRAVLVGAAVLALIAALAAGEWLAAGAMVVAIAFHGGLFVHFHRQRQRAGQPPEIEMRTSSDA